VTRASSDAEAAGTPSGPAASRIIAAESLQGAQAFDLTELAGALAPAPRRLTARDLSNETARAAYALGHRRGYEQGARAGLQQGFTEGSQALEAHQSRKAADVAGQMQRILDAFGRDMAALEAQVASDLVSLAVDIARQVLRRELSLDEQALLPAAREALRTLAEGASALEIHLHPDDASRIAPNLDAVQAGRCKVQEDASLPRGGCRVEGDTGIAEAGFDTRWQAVMARLGRDEEPGL
jgi:flagellar assembly protein FliH